MALTETLDSFLADFGVAVSFSGSTAGMLGIPDAPGALELASISGIGQGQQFPGVQASDRTVLIRTDQKGALVPGTAITVNSVSGTTRMVLAFEDAAFTLVSWRPS